MINLSLEIFCEDRVVSDYFIILIIFEVMRKDRRNKIKKIKEYLF